MASIARLNVARALKQTFELTGEYAPSLEESVLPTVQLLDIEDTPFGLTKRFSVAAIVAPVVGQYSWLSVGVSPALPRNSWISIDEIWLATQGVAALGFWVIAGLWDDFPAVSPVGAPRNVQQPESSGTLANVTEAYVTGGTSATGPISGGAYVVLTPSMGTLVIKGRWAIRGKDGAAPGAAGGGGFALTTNSTNADLVATLFGRIHLTSAR